MEWILQVLGGIAIIGAGELIKKSEDKNQYILAYGICCMLIGMALF